MTAKKTTGASYSDVYLALGVLVIMALMVLRLPVAVIDALVAVNIALGMGLLLIAIYIPTPVAFSSFPSVLLISTLFRLSLSVATTRLILLNGDAGHIIDAFGQFVAGGNLVVGIVVFVIITVVQFIVIAKGAERVAEVSARFTLDAMPGKQMSIDSDLRSGLIDQVEAKKRRELLAQESELNGALDGAMKFVKGDAIASIIIVIVNLVGGLTIGVMQRQMGIGDAMAVYSILTIGDGMVAQVPALLGAMAAGLVVTRSGGDSEGHLGSLIGEQIMKQPRALIATGIISLLMAMVPGFPTLVFLSLAALLIGIGYVADPKQVTSFFRRGSVAKEEQARSDKHTSNNAQIGHTALPLLFEYGNDCETLDLDALANNIHVVRRKVSEDLGILLPICEFRKNTSLTGYRYSIYDVDIKDATQTEVPVSENSIAEQFEPLMRKHASRFLGIQEVNDLITKVSDDYGALVKEVLRSVSIQHIAQILRNLVDEGIPIRNLRDIFEALVEWGGREKDPDSLSEFVRIGLKRTITAQYVNDNNDLSAVLIQADVEDIIRNGLNQTPAGLMLSLAPNQIQHLLKNLLPLVEHDQAPAVLLTAADVRRHLYELVKTQFPRLSVLSYQELNMPVNVIKQGQLTLRPQAA